MAALGPAWAQNIEPEAIHFQLSALKIEGQLVGIGVDMGVNSLSQGCEVRRKMREIIHRSV